MAESRKSTTGFHSELSPVRALVIDDNLEMLRSYARWLQRNHYLFKLASTKAEAIEQLESSAKEGTIFDLVILDYFLNGTNGTELLPYIRRLQPDAVVVVISGFLNAQIDVEIAFLCDFAVQKPLNFQIFSTLVQKASKRKQEYTDRLADFFLETGLSPREQAVIQSALKKKSGKQTADALGCAESTVYTYWRRIFAKTHCSSQRDVLALLARFSNRCG